MKELHVGYLAAGGLALVLALFSYQVRRLPVSGPLLALALGVLAGPEVFNVLTIPDSLLELLLLESARLILAISLIGVALRFPFTSLRQVLRPVVLLVAVVMPLAAVVTGGLAFVLVGLPLSLALLLGASLAPTDPVLASDVVSGMPAEEELPETTRQVLTEESGANDGLALPLVLIALAPVLGKTAVGQAQTALYEVVVAVVLSVAIGAATAGTLRFLEARGNVERPSEMVLTLVMAVAVLGACRVVDSNGVLGVFVAGLSYNAVIRKMDREEQEALDEVANQYLVLPFFLLVGVVLPWEQWGRIGGDVVLFAVAVIVLRRLPVVVALARLLGLRLRDALFIGWFGPLGASSVFYLAFTVEEGADDPRVFALGMAVVVLSTFVHGVSAIPLRKLHARGEC